MVLKLNKSRSQLDLTTYPVGLDMYGKARERERENWLLHLDMGFSKVDTHWCAIQHTLTQHSIT